MLSHHELCFGCGRTNLFGLMLELEPGDDGSAGGRCFIKQDHQGPDKGAAHPGVIASALCEAMMLAAGAEARIAHLSFETSGRVAVGSFLDVEASAGVGSARAVASFEGQPVATATATLARS